MPLDPLSPGKFNTTREVWSHFRGRQREVNQEILSNGGYGHWALARVAQVFLLFFPYALSYWVVPLQNVVMKTLVSAAVLPLVVLIIKTCFARFYELWLEPWINGSIFDRFSDSYLKRLLFSFAFVHGLILLVKTVAPINNTSYDHATK